MPVLLKYFFAKEGLDLLNTVIPKIIIVVINSIENDFRFDFDFFLTSVYCSKKSSRIF